MVFRTYRCAFDHEWKDLVQRGSPPPGECPTCTAIVAAIDPPHAPARARSETLAAPGIRGEQTKAVARFERNNMVRPHYDDGSPLLTNLRDNVREGESYAVPETVSTSETMRLTKEMIDSAAHARQTEGAGLVALGGGWQGASGEAAARALAAAGGPQNPFGRPAVDLQSKRRA